MNALTTKNQRLTALRLLSPESVASLAAAWDVRMVYECNSTEGNTLTHRETELVLSKGLTSGKSLKDHLEAVNLFLAWAQVKELAISKASLTASDLRYFHRVLLTRIRDDIAGNFRGYFVRVDNSKQVRPKAVEVPGLVDDLLMDIHSIADPVERAARLHHGIARIHPFTDGNGRTARLAMNFALLAAGYPPISIPTELRQDYYNALEAADSGDFPAWLDFLTTRLHHELDQWLDALGETQEQKPPA